MRLLAIDTALTNCAVALVDGETTQTCLATVAEEIGRGHAERLMPMVDEVLEQASAGFETIDRFVVTTGPGSFTGLRVGLSVARGFGLVTGKPVVGISTLEALAHGAAAQLAGRPLCVALTGKGNEVYSQFFDCNAQPAGEGMVRTLDQLQTELPSDCLLAGSAAERIAEVAGLPAEAILNTSAYPDILSVAALGAVRDPSEAEPSPLYLRPPDATPQKKGRIARA